MSRETPLTPDYGVTVEGQPGESLLDLDLARVAKLYRLHGAIWFHGFDPSVENFKKFTSSLSTSFIEYVGGAMSRTPIGGDQTVVAVTGATDNFGVPLHAELYYRAKHPRLLWFYCDRVAATGGETTVCDGFVAFEKFSEHTKKLMRTRKIVYIRRYAEAEWQSIYQTTNIDDVKKHCVENELQLEVNADRSITTRYTTSPIVPDREGKRFGFLNNILPIISQELEGKRSNQLRLDDGYGIPHDVLLEIRFLTEIMTHPVAWKNGDLLMVDNTRMLHGRRAFTGNERAVYSRLGDPNFA